MIKFIDFPKSYKKIRKEILKEIDRVLLAGDLILRSDVSKFEKRLAKFVGTSYAVAVNSCTDALYLALRGLKIGQGDEVLVPSRTFVATAQVIVQVGATPVFYDLDGILKFTNKTKAIIPVHIEGAFDPHFDEILKLAKTKGWYVIEDAAQALGAIKDGEKAGSFGICGCFSFYPAKILGAYGDAGALTTNDGKLYNWAKDARNHFKDDARDWGVNSRCDNIQAAVLNVRFKYLENTLKRRAEIAKTYLKELKGIEGLELPSNIKGRVWQDFIVRTERRNELFDHLKQNGVEIMKNNYPFPVPKLPLAQKYENETLRLPCSPELTNKEIIIICNLIKKFNFKEV